MAWQNKILREIYGPTFEADYGMQEIVNFKSPDILFETRA